MNTGIGAIIRPLTESSKRNVIWIMMHADMALRAQRYQILVGVRTSMTAERLMVDLKVRHPAAGLTSPAVTTQHLLP